MAPDPVPEPKHDSRIRGRLRPLPTWTRVLLYVLGWFLVVLGLVGLVLPGIQGILSLVFGAAALSLASRGFHMRLRTLFRRWPRAWEQVERLRGKIHRYLSRDESGET